MSTDHRAKPPALSKVRELFEEPLLQLVFRAAAIHREHHRPEAVQRSQLLSVKTGGCPEDCSYCSQSVHFDTPIAAQRLLPLEEVLAAARSAKAGGADRFCMGAAWRAAPNGRQFRSILEMVEKVKALGLETCATLGSLDLDQGRQLKAAGLDYYNHNLDTGRSYYDRVVSTHTYDDRLATLRNVREAGLRLCCGGILGLGESESQRAELLWQLAQLDPPPESVPINTLVAIPGTPLAEAPPVDWSDVVRTVAVARVLLPRADLRLSAGRGELSEEAQALAFLAGANSIFVGEELLTTPNPEPSDDDRLLAKLGLVSLARARQPAGSRS